MEEVESTGTVNFDTSDMNTGSRLLAFGLLHASLTRLRSQMRCLATILSPEKGVLPHL